MTELENQLIEDNEMLNQICRKMVDLYIDEKEKESFKLCLAGNSFCVILQYLEKEWYKKNGINIDEVDNRSMESLDSLITDFYNEKDMYLHHYE